MGRELKTTIVADGVRSMAVVLLESEEIIVRGELRQRIPFSSISAARVSGATLDVTHALGHLSIELGDTADAWLARIRSPKSLIDKLGVGPTHRVVVLSLDDAVFLADLRTRCHHVTTRLTTSKPDVVVVGCRAMSDLDRLAEFEGKITRDGAIWTVWAKGRRELREDDIRRAATAAGLVDVKVVKFSETHSALKLVIPKDRR